MSMTQEQFFSDFLANADFEDSVHDVAVARINMLTEPMNWGGGVSVRQMTSRSEVTVDIKHGLMTYGFVYALVTEVDYGDIEFGESFTLGDLKPKIALDDEVAKDYAAFLISQDDDVKQQITDVFGRNAENSKVADPAKTLSVEFLLRRAVADKLNSLLQDGIENQDFDSQFMLTMSDVAKKSVEVAVTSMQTMLDRWAGETTDDIE